MYTLHIITYRLLTRPFLHAKWSSVSVKQTRSFSSYPIVKITIFRIPLCTPAQEAYISWYKCENDLFSCANVFYQDHGHINPKERLYTDIVSALYDVKDVLLQNLRKANKFTCMDGLVSEHYKYADHRLYVLFYCLIQWLYMGISQLV